MAYEPELERLERRYQDDPARNFAQLAETYRKAGRLDDALTLLQGHLSERPNYVSGLVVLGRCLLDQQNDPEARATFERVLAVDAEHIIALRALGEIAERAGDLGGAHQWFTRLLDVDPMNEDAEAAVARITAAGAAPPPAEPPAEAPVSIASMLVDEDMVGAADTGPADRADETGAVEEAGWVGRAAGFAGDEPAEPPASEFVIEQADDSFMPRASGARPMGVEPIGEMEIRSQLPEEEPVIGGAALDEEAPADAAGAEAGVMPFDDALGWGAGERTSQQISGEDMDEIAHVHEDTTTPVSELPGLETTEVPSAADGADVGHVEGLHVLDTSGVVPLEGLEPTVAAEAAEAGAVAPPDEFAAAEEPPIHFVEPPAPEPLEIVSEEVVPVVPEVQPESEEATLDAAGEVVDRGTAERRASLMGLPLLDQPPPPEPETPLVLEPEPEPVVTETMAELYVKQGLFEEAREVYEQLLGQHPGDARLTARLAELKKRVDTAVASTAATPLAAAAPAPQFAAASGGRSVRGLMLDVLAARPAEVGLVTPVVPAVPVAPAAPVAPAPPIEPIDEAFAEDADEAQETSLGAPTQPAEDEVTLSAVFGDAPSAPPAPTPPSATPKPTAQEAKAGTRPPGGFSFDEFFGKPGSGGEATPRRDTLADDEGEEAFRDWLKGLKG